MGAMELIGLARISTTGQDTAGQSLDTQRQKITSYCLQRGHDLLRIVSGVESTSRPVIKRKKLQEVLNQIEAGKAEGLLVTTTDRLFRNALQARILAERSIMNRWHLLVIEGDYDFTIPADLMRFTILCAIDEYQRLEGRRKTMEGLENARRKGVKLGRPVRTSAPTRAMIKQLHDSGLNARQIADKLNKSTRWPSVSGNPWTTRMIFSQLESIEKQALTHPYHRVEVQ
jgi:DNA invertase Pin-like site-specific DNA recombinase